MELLRRAGWAPTLPPPQLSRKERRRGQRAKRKAALERALRSNASAVHLRAALRALRRGGAAASAGGGLRRLGEAAAAVEVGDMGTVADEAEAEEEEAEEAAEEVGEVGGCPRARCCRAVAGVITR